jgi:ATP-dependent helicase/nuclease subunit A
MPCAKAWKLSNMEAFRSKALASVADKGYAATIQEWIELAQLAEPEAFLADRADTILGAAEAFDRRSSPNEGIDAFIASIEGLEMHESEASGVIRLMTVHQSKGLGFEMVIVCGLDESSHGQSSNELVLGPDKKNPRWGMLLPRKEVSECDPILKKQADQLAAESKTADLCGAYVAMTRAKKALYVITDSLPARTSAKHFGRLLNLTLPENWQTGEKEWFEND